MSNGRAKKGGEIGQNGEFYAGGTFLPSTSLPKQGAQARKKGGGKEEIAPYEWAPAPEGMRSIYGQIRALVAWGAKPSPLRDEVLAYYGQSPERIQALLDRYLAGERWTEAN